MALQGDAVRREAQPHLALRRLSPARLMHLQLVLCWGAPLVAGAGDDFARRRGAVRRGAMRSGAMRCGAAIPGAYLPEQCPGPQSLRPLRLSLPLLISFNVRLPLLMLSSIIV